MLTSKTQHYWKGKLLSDCSKEELLDCIEYIYEYYVKNKGKTYFDIPGMPVSPNYLKQEQYAKPVEIWCKN